VIGVEGDPRRGLSIECEVTDRPSMAGRTIDLYIDEETRERLFLAMRDEMVRARRG
jgi:hypothetical protein